jgi:hypothetical protein
MQCVSIPDSTTSKELCKYFFVLRIKIFIGVPRLLLAGTASCFPLMPGRLSQGLKPHPAPAHTCFLKESRYTYTQPDICCQVLLVIIFKKKPGP